MKKFEVTDGEKCMLLRRRLGVTQAEAAELLKVCHVTVHRMERDERDAEPLLKVLMRFEKKP
jgi:DNA-binding XRE family transcriptional regulator